MVISAWCAGVLLFATERKDAIFHAVIQKHVLAHAILWLHSDVRRRRKSTFT